MGKNSMGYAYYKQITAKQAKARLRRQLINELIGAVAIVGFFALLAWVVRNADTIDAWRFCS